LPLSIKQKKGQQVIIANMGAKAIMKMLSGATGLK
jgi:hypothetical protein